MTPKLYKDICRVCKGYLPLIISRVQKFQRGVGETELVFNQKSWTETKRSIQFEISMKLDARSLSCFEMTLKSFVLLLVFSTLAVAKPSGDQIVFRDEEDSDSGAGELLKLEDEKQILPSEQTRLIGSEAESVVLKLENGKYYQGDIVLVQEQKEYLLANDSDLPTRTGWIDEAYRWPKDNRGNVILPYYVSPQSQFSKMITRFKASLWIIHFQICFFTTATYQKKLIRAAMDDLQAYTCVTFVERTHQQDYVYIVDGDGCSSHLGKIGDRQEVTLSKEGCFARGIIMHELIHALGYDHMVNMS